MAKAKKKQLSEVAQQRRKETNKKTLNPFEVHINRDKQNVLGRKNKVDRGLPGVSRAKAIKKRKGTLLQEYKQKNKDNLFLDKRIGEKNLSMSQEDKAMARFAAERVKAHKKKNIFNLNDDEKLTHRGQTLEDIERFDDPKSDDEFSDEDNRTGKLDNQFVDEVHFGGGILSKPGHAKSRKDIIEELIAESKKRKAEKQKIREQTLDLTEKLDSDWKDLLPIVSAANKSLEDVQDAKRADDFDMTMRQLKFEPRGVPSDKLKSEEDMIREEKERLEALEKDRLARMKGFINGTNNEIKHKSADDLDDGFMVVGINETDQEAEGKTDLNYDSSNESSEEDENEPNVDAGNENNENNDDEDEDESGSNNDVTEVTPNNVSLENTEETNTNLDNKPLEDESPNQSDIENSEADESDADSLSDLKESESASEDENVPPKKTVTFGHIDQQKIKNSSEMASILKVKQDANLEKKEKSERENEIRIDLLKRKEIMEKARKELPYTYSAPENFEELQTLLENHNPVYQSVIVDRIIKCNHWSLKNGENKEKLCNLFSYLLQHIDQCVSAANPENITDSFEILDRLSPYIYDLAHINAESTKISMQDIIKKKHEEFEQNKKQYPNLDTLVLFKLVSLLFPTSDFRHPVVTPCLIFMSQILLRSRVKSNADIAKGLFICTLILEYTVLSKRFSPSAINFLRGVIYSATPKHLIQGIKIIPPFKTTGELSNLLIINNGNASEDVDPLVRMRAKDLLDNDLDDDFKIRALLTAINLLQDFKNNFEEIEASYAIFEPILKLLKPNTFERYPTVVKDHVKKFETELEQLKNKNLEYIVIQRKKPKPLKMYEPRIERVYDGKMHKPMSKEKAEREKLLHKYKKEMKGAIREIRRDRSFLAKVQIKQQIKSDAERKRKVKEIFGEAAVQQSEFKKMKRKK